MTPSGPPSPDGSLLGYAEALRTVRAEPADPYPLRLLSSATTNEFAVFLRAYAVRRGGGWAITGRDYGPLEAQLAAPDAGTGALVVLLGVEDVFPELSGRADVAWTSALVREVVAESRERIRVAAKRLRAAVEDRRGPVVVVPPVADAFPLPISSPRLASRIDRLGAAIDEAVHDELEDTGARVLNVALALERLPRARWRDDRLWYETGAPLSVEAASSLAAAVDGELEPPRRRKVLVTDLDNTLWRGVFGEDGPAGVGSHAHGPQHVHRVWQRMLRLAAEEGMLLAVCSKNDPDALAFLGAVEERERAGLLLGPEEFAAASVSWEPKSVQLAAIAERLGLPPDALVLVDDNPVETAEVAAAGTGVLPLRFPARSAGLHRFARAVQRAVAADGAPVTEEARSRTRLYALRERAEQDRLRADSLEAFLAGLDMRMRIEPVDRRTDDRARELLNRTNQFHLTGNRYDEDAWAGLRARAAGYVARLTDTYGDHGICAVCVLADPPEILELAMSCRVLNRTVETAVLRWIADRLGVPLTARWRPTGRNDRVRDTLTAHGFAAADAAAPMILADATAPHRTDCFVRTASAP